MKKILTAALAALTLGGAAMATATPAAAYPHGGWRGDDAGLAIGAGLAGLVVGAALADRPNYYSYGPGYGYGPGPYYGPAYPAYGVCYAPRRVWDPYMGAWIMRDVRYPC